MSVFYFFYFLFLITVWSHAGKTISIHDSCSGAFDYIILSSSVDALCSVDITKEKFKPFNLSTLMMLSFLSAVLSNTTPKKKKKKKESVLS